MENGCIQDTKLCGARDFDKNKGVFLGEGMLQDRAKDKKKSARWTRTLLLFFVVYDI